MKSSEEAMFRLRAKLPSHQRRVARAREIISAAFSENKNWYVALSGGKDSTCVLALAREQQPDIPAVFADDEWWLPETEDYLKNLTAKQVDLRWIRLNAHHTEWFEPRGDYDSIQDYASQQGWQGCLLGLRKSESSKRRVHILQCGETFLAQSDGFWRCYPLADWSTLDVWAFIVSQGLDYNRAYDRLAELDVPLERRRIGPFAVERVLGYGQLALLKRGWPDLFDAFAARYPEARNFV